MRTLKSRNGRRAVTFLLAHYGARVVFNVMLCSDRARLRRHPRQMTALRGIAQTHLDPQNIVRHFETALS